MATGIFAVFDDIAMLLDDAAAMSKMATKKTAGILGDDLAVSAQKASSFASERELPVLWAITKGSFKNKLIILPMAFLLSAFASWLIVPILLLGGIYLAYEGVEKIYEYFIPSHEHKEIDTKHYTKEEILEKEKTKIKSAIFTDFILSVEIVMIALGSVATQPLTIQVIAVSFVAFVATIGVYGTVALLVRMDDFGFKLIKIANDEKRVMKKTGELLVAALPKIIKNLTVLGTVAMVLVAGGIFVHNIHQIHDFLHFLPDLAAEFITGLLVGAWALFFQRIFILFRPSSNQNTAKDD